MKSGGGVKTIKDSKSVSWNEKATTKYSSNVALPSQGGASRFFYVAKASKSNRGEGNIHPTVKSTKLMEYLITLITPPGGIVLDPSWEVEVRVLLQNVWDLILLVSKKK